MPDDNCDLLKNSRPDAEKQLLPRLSRDGYPPVLYTKASLQMTRGTWDSDLVTSAAVCSRSLC